MISLRKKTNFLVISFVLLAMTQAASSGVSASGNVPTPSEFLGFKVGADRKLADYKQITSYFNALAAVSKKIEIENLG